MNPSRYTWCAPCIKLPAVDLPSWICRLAWRTIVQNCNLPRPGRRGEGAATSGWIFETPPIRRKIGVSYFVLAEALSATARGNADLVLLISPSKRAGEFVAAARDAALPASIATLSYGHADTICRIASAEKAVGVGMAQVFPNIRNRALRIVREYQDDLARFGAGAKPSLMQFEAYIAAKVLLEGLRRAGKSPTRPKLVQALNSLRDYDLGGFAVDFAEGRHNGSMFVDMSIIGRECQLVY